MVRAGSRSRGRTRLGDGHQRPLPCYFTPCAVGNGLRMGRGRRNGGSPQEKQARRPEQESAHREPFQNRPLNGARPPPHRRGRLFARPPAWR
jgi:hypothetical protein